MLPYGKIQVHQEVCRSVGTRLVEREKEVQVGSEQRVQGCSGDESKLKRYERDKIT